MAELMAACYTHGTMMRASVDIGVNWVSWLREQAVRHYVWYAAAQYHRVLHPRQTSDISPGRTLRDAWQRLPPQHDKFPNLRSNLFIRLLHNLPVSARAHISDFFTAHGLRDFRFLDHGGNAITFRAYHIPTGQIRVARLEAPHSGRFQRPRHPVILQPYASNEGHYHFYGNVKLEVLPEIVPLARLYLEINKIQIPLLKHVFQDAVYDIACGTNLMYGSRMFDLDAEAQNVGFRWDGCVLSFDPEIITGAAAQDMLHDYETPKLLRDANAQQLALIYPAI